MRTWLKISAVLVTLSVPVPFIACGASAGANSAKNNAVAVNTQASPLTSPTPDQVAALRELYKTQCSQCHKETGKGGESVVDGKKIDARDLTSDKMAKRSDAKLYDDIAEGSPDDGMPAFKEKLNEGQINDVIKYIRTELQHAK